MARKALKVSQQRKRQRCMQQRAAGKKSLYLTRVYNRCRLCGRVGGYMRRFDLCRICFREHARRGELMGVKKCSW